MRSRSHFRRGETTFRCSCCGRLTRHTGVQSLGTSVCPQDFELAGIYNVHQDGGDVTQYAAEIRELTSEIVSKGGTLDSDALELLAMIGSPAAAGDA